MFDASALCWRTSRTAVAEANVFSVFRQAVEMSGPTCVVFLDVDGVLLPFGDGAAAGPADGGFPDAPLAALSAILEATGATIVLSSTWRCAPEAIAELTSAFFFYACTHGGPLGNIASFAHLTNPAAHSTRQAEIAEWLASLLV